MKNILLSGLLLSALLSFMLVQCQSTWQGGNLTTEVKALLDTLAEKDQALKILDLYDKNQFIWLSLTGELHAVDHKGTDHTKLLYSSKHWNDVTFVEDFCLNATRDSIYFTDLMDLQSGKGAIKLTDIKGTQIHTLTTLDNEIPYQLWLHNEQQKLYFLAKKIKIGHNEYLLRYFDLQKDQKGTIYASTAKIENLRFDGVQQLLILNDSQNRQLAFSTEHIKPAALAENLLSQ